MRGFGRSIKVLMLLGPLVMPQLARAQHLLPNTPGMPSVRQFGVGSPLGPGIGAFGSAEYGSWVSPFGSGFFLGPYPDPGSAGLASYIGAGATPFTYFGYSPATWPVGAGSAMANDTVWQPWQTFHPLATVAAPQLQSVIASTQSRNHMRTRLSPRTQRQRPRAVAHRQR